jgi:hypothetical protein
MGANLSKAMGKWYTYSAMTLLSNLAHARCWRSFMGAMLDKEPARSIVRLVTLRLTCREAVWESGDEDIDVGVGRSGKNE